jgi:hypothetical protein
LHRCEAVQADGHSVQRLPSVIEVHAVGTPPDSQTLPEHT